LTCRSPKHFHIVTTLAATWKTRQRLKRLVTLYPTNPGTSEIEYIHSRNRPLTSSFRFSGFSGREFNAINTTNEME
jgi:hypothetical protein